MYGQWVTGDFWSQGVAWIEIEIPQPGQPCLKFEVDQGYDMNIVQYYTKLVLYNINHTHTPSYFCEGGHTTHSPHKRGE